LPLHTCTASAPQHLAWALENLVEGRVVNRIKVRDDVKHWARVALNRMLEVRAVRQEMKTFTLDEAQALLPGARIAAEACD